MSEHKIVIYSTPTCHFCTLAKGFLEGEKIAFEEKDVSVDAKAREAMIEKSGQMGVPVIDIDGQIIVGFDQEKIKKLLGL